ncbi:MAG: sugar ABC transporter substrate-binding protein [Bradyrhizobiaceae bacterium]|nr:sugar ABC transporter substrate-binding protein [Bradyrhizobiaceae bacterium]
MHCVIDRRQFTRLVVGSGALVAGSGLGAFAQAKKRVAFANISDEIPFGASVLRGVKDAAAKRTDMEATFFDNRNDAARALDNARAVVAAKFDLFIEYNAQAGSNLPIWRMMQEAKIPILAVQIGVGEAPLFAVDNRISGTDSGRVLAETAKSRWSGQEPVAIIISIPEAGPFIAERAAGAKEAIQKVYSGIEFVEFSSRNDAGHTRQLVTDTLTRFPNRKVICWVHVDAMALSALAAVRNAGRAADVFITTTGGDRAAFPEIRADNSPFLGTYAFFPELWGNDIIQLAAEMLAGKTLPKLIHPKRQLFLTKQNINEYYPS